MSDMKVVRIAPNNQVFDLPVIVGIQEGLFAEAGLDVAFAATHADREKDSAEKPVFSRLKENCSSAAKPTATTSANGPASTGSSAASAAATSPPCGLRWRRRRS